VMELKAYATMPGCLRVSLLYRDNVIKATLVYKASFRPARTT